MPPPTPSESAQREVNGHFRVHFRRSLSPRQAAPVHFPPGSSTRRAEAHAWRHSLRSSARLGWTATRSSSAAVSLRAITRARKHTPSSGPDANAPFTSPARLPVPRRSPAGRHVAHLARAPGQPRAPRLSPRDTPFVRACPRALRAAGLCLPREPHEPPSCPRSPGPPPRAHLGARAVTRAEPNGRKWVKAAIRRHRPHAVSRAYEAS